MLVHLLADGAVEHLVGVLVAVHEVGKLEELEDVHGVFPEISRHGHLDGAELHSLDEFLLRSELAVGVDLDLELAVGLLFDHGLEGFIQDLVGEILRGEIVGDLDDLRRRSGPDERNENNKREEQDTGTFHHTLLNLLGMELPSEEILRIFSILYP